MRDQDDGLYIVASGWLKALKSAASGREQTIATFGPGAALNDVAVLAGAPTQATLVALEPTTLWRIPRAHLLGLLAEHPILASALIGSLASRVIHLAALIEDLALRPVEARLARLLLSQAHDGQMVAVISTQGSGIGSILQRLQQGMVVVFALTGLYLFALPWWVRWRRGRNRGQAGPCARRSPTS